MKYRREPNAYGEHRMMRARDIILSQLGDNEVPKFTCAHEFLVYVYSNDDLPIGPRLEAAKVAIAYEKPKLNAVSIKNADEDDALVIVTGVPQTLEEAKVIRSEAIEDAEIVDADS